MALKTSLKLRLPYQVHSYAQTLQAFKFSTQENNDRSNYRKSIYKNVVGATFVGVASFALYRYLEDEKKVLAATEEITQSGNVKEGLPFYSLDEIRKHDSKEKKIWITYKQGVYDITEFIPKHPGGGEKIMMAAGGSVDPFWMIYGVHRNQDILNMLEQYRIGNLSEEESKISVQDMSDPYAFEPRRHPALQPRSLKPYNAEPPLKLLADNFITPTELFFVRNHLPVPEIDIATYEIEIEGVGLKPIKLNLEKLKKFKRHTVTAAVQCSGNRRSEMIEVKPVKGLSWGQAAIGNATWTGVRLRDVLLAAGLKEDPKGVEHIQFEGLDTDPSMNPYGASIPIEKALDPKGDVLLAFEMNGQPLTKDHGYPVRVVVPGVTGARNVKWLGKIIVSGKESDSHWQQNDYKGFSPSTDWDTVDFSSAPAIQELPVISAICDPIQNEKVKPVNGKIPIRGYAWSGGGRKIVRVDVTWDQGKTWSVATLEQEEAKHPHHWGWSLWKVEVPVPQNADKIEVWAKAVDSQYNSQPESFANIWNLRGVLSNAYHRVTVNIDKGKK
ncbi:sulfite oxidase [Neocloeon triangulifer]|uniref:sulfite oxidase n=1 Tax=Neocloeon triangulifer TaxID=2078957 RepID=UPI00286F8EFD|nr:sulfite oxidase [Neocloeon triangulifer]XP_059477285.1 sulfite oxidase [Neocloeon triangulifer]